MRELCISACCCVMRVLFLFDRFLVFGLDVVVVPLLEVMSVEILKNRLNGPHPDPLSTKRNMGP